MGSGHNDSFFGEGRTIFSAIAGPGDDEHVSAMRQPIQPGGREQWIGEPGRPFGRRTITGQQNRAVLIAFVDDVIEILRGRWLHRFEAEVINDQKIGPGIAGEAFVVGAIGTPSMEVAQHFVSVGEDDIETAPTSFVSKPVSEMTFSNAGRTAEQHIAFVTNIRPGGEVVDQLAIQAGLNAKSNVSRVLLVLSVARRKRMASCF